MSVIWWSDPNGGMTSVLRGPTTLLSKPVSTPYPFSTSASVPLTSAGFSTASSTTTTPNNIPTSSTSAVSHTTPPTPSYSRSALIAALIIVSLIVIAALSWTLHRLYQRSVASSRGLEIPDDEECYPAEAARPVPQRRSIFANVGFRASEWIKPAPALFKESEIGVATTTSLPASSSKTAVAKDAYPLKRKVDNDEATALDEKLASPPPDEPGNRGQTHLSVDFIPLSQMAHLRKQPTYRSPTESLYKCYE